MLNASNEKTVVYVCSSKENYYVHQMVL